MRGIYFCPFKVYQIGSHAQEGVDISQCHVHIVGLGFVQCLVFKHFFQTLLMCFQCILSLCLGFRNGSVIEMLQFFFNCHAWSSPAYNFKPMASLTYPVIKSGLRPVPCLSGISMIKGVLWVSFTSSTIWGISLPNFSVRSMIPISLLEIAFCRNSILNYLNKTLILVQYKNDSYMDYYALFEILLPYIGLF